MPKELIGAQKEQICIAFRRAGSKIFLLVTVAGAGRNINPL
jgi:hypothetical protein